MARLGEMERDAREYYSRGAAPTPGKSDSFSDGYGIKLVRKLVKQSVIQGNNLNELNPGLLELESRSGETPKDSLFLFLLGNQYRLMGNEPKMTQYFFQITSHRLLLVCNFLLAEWYGSDRIRMIEWYVQTIRLCPDRPHATLQSMIDCGETMVEPEEQEIFTRGVEEISYMLAVQSDLGEPILNLYYSLLRLAGRMGSGLCCLSYYRFSSSPDRDELFQRALDLKYGPAYTYQAQIYSDDPTAQLDCYLKGVEYGDLSKLTIIIKHYVHYPCLEGFLFSIKYKQERSSRAIYQSAPSIHPHYLLRLNTRLHGLEKERRDYLAFFAGFLRDPTTYFSAYCVGDIQREILRYLA